MAKARGIPPLGRTPNALPAPQAPAYLPMAKARGITQDLVIMDNASIHTSEEFEHRIPSWKKQGLVIKYLPPYSPELNLIEILWRRIKYTWLPFSAYESLNALSEALEAILSHVGSEYQITFA